eukprot:Gb_25465 [translate_table: standard]
MAFVSVVKCMVAPQCGIPRSSMHRCSASSIHGAKLQFETAKSHRVFMTATLPSKSEEVEEVKKPFNPRKSDGRVNHSMAPEKMEIFKSLENWAERNVLVNLKPVERSWQPQDFLPNPSSESFQDEIKELQERALEIPDEYYVCLVGDMITEEALPTYMSLLNRTDGMRDETDEKRHETAYAKIVEKLFEIDPDCTLLGVYTASDYADMLEFFVKRWNVEKLCGLSSEGRKAQEYVCKLAPRIRKLEERAQEMSKGGQSCPFSWIFNREVAL